MRQNMLYCSVILFFDVRDIYLITAFWQTSPWHEHNFTGAQVFYKGSFHRVADPLRHFTDGVGSLFNPIGSPLDKINVGLFRTKTLLSSFQATLQKDETSISERLRVSFQLSAGLQIVIWYLQCRVQLRPRSCNVLKSCARRHSCDF